MANFNTLFCFVFLLILSTSFSKIVLPNKLRYLENMLTSEVMAKAARIRQRLEGNPNIQETDTRNWPLLLAKYNQEDPNTMKSKSMYHRRIPF